MAKYKLVMVIKSNLYENRLEINECIIKTPRAIFKEN